MFTRLFLSCTLATIACFSSHATGNWEANKNPNKEAVSDKDSEVVTSSTRIEKKSEEQLLPDMNEEQTWKMSDPDSSRYSVNKFNYLFYFIYRVKYADQNSDSKDGKFDLTD